MEMMDYIDANSNIFFEYSLPAQGIFEEVVPAHRNEEGPCHRQIAPHKRPPGEGTSGRCLCRRFSYDIHTNMISYNRTGASPVSKTMSYVGNRMTSVKTPGAGGGAIRYDAIGRIVSSDIERLTQVRYNVVGYPSFLAQADGGYVDFSGSEPRYCWYTKDHLGSVSSVVGGMTKLAGETAKTATEGNTKPSGRALSIEQGVLKTEEVSDIHGMCYNPKF